ncbi:hypothetical protein BGX29_011692 [Mortierella sp. GBA35]|nr:hypothetical protein BGX29_011692 [Mortierella sp. GBA35]
MSQPAQKSKKKKKEKAPKVFSHNYVKVFQVPELVEHILSLLDQRSLHLTALLVCRLWYKAALPLIHRSATIVLDPPYRDLSDPLGKDNYDKDAIDDIQGARILIIKPPVADPYWGIRGPPRLTKIHHQALMNRLNDLAQQQELNIIDLRILYYMDYQSDVLPILTVTGAKLTTIRLSQMQFQECLPLDEILLLCPRLLHLRISQRVSQPAGHRLAACYCLRNTRNQSSPLPLPDHLQLRSLSLDGFGIEADYLLRLLRIAPALTDLRLSQMKGGETIPESDQLFLPEHSRTLRSQDLVSWTNDTFFEQLATTSPQITRLSISMIKPSKIKSLDLVKILQRFPALAHWETPDIDISSQTLDTFRTTIADRVTSLEITGELNQDVVGRALHKYLGGTPHLQHLRAQNVYVSVAWLDVEGILDNDGQYRWQKDNGQSGQSGGDEQLQTRVWMTRNLKTLHLGFGTGTNGSSDFHSYEASRMVYGYISKTCPRLRDLSISNPGLLLCLEGGASLLSRLQELRRVVVMTASKEKLKKEDLDWLALDLDPARKVEKKRLMERFVTVEDRTIYSRTPFRSTLLSQDLPLKGRQQHLRPTIKEAQSTDRRYRDNVSNSESETDEDTDTTESGDRIKSKETRKKKGPPKDTNEAPDYMMAGVDMRDLGHLQDIAAMFKSRAAQRWQCWPELEYLEFQSYPYSQLDDNETIVKWAQAIRPRIQFKCQRAASRTV